MQSTFGLPGHADNGRCQRVNPFHINSFCKGLASRQTFLFCPDWELPPINWSVAMAHALLQLNTQDGNNAAVLRVESRAPACNSFVRAVMVCVARTRRRGVAAWVATPRERCEHRDGGIGNASGSEPEDSRFEPWSLCSLAWPSSEGTRLQTATIGGASPSASSTPR
jgi:hypothetical protein